MARELTREEKAKIRKLVTKWCANYDKLFISFARFAAASLIS